MRETTWVLKTIWAFIVRHKAYVFGLLLLWAIARFSFHLAEGDLTGVLLNSIGIVCWSYYLFGALHRQSTR